MFIGKVFYAAISTQGSPASFINVIPEVVGAEWSIAQEVKYPNDDSEPIAGRIRVSGIVYTMDAFSYEIGMEQVTEGQVAQARLQLSFLEEGQIMANVNRPSSQSPNSPARFRLIRFRHVIFGTVGTKVASYRDPNNPLSPVNQLGFTMAIPRLRTGSTVPLRIRDVIETRKVYVNDDGSHRELSS